MKRIRHTGIVVADLDKSLDFYQKLLGLKVIKNKEESGKYIDDILKLSNARVVTVKLAADDGSLVELLYYKTHPKVSSVDRDATDVGISHIAFETADIASEYDKMVKAGVRFNSTPRTSPDGYAKVVFCKDPDGNLIELVEVLIKDDK